MALITRPSQVVGLRRNKQLEKYLLFFKMSMCLCSLYVKKGEQIVCFLGQAV